MLRRFADARLARHLAEATVLVRRLNGLLRQKTAEAATNYALAQRWKSIARDAQDQLAAERARTQEPAGRCGDIAPSLSLLASRTRPTCRLTAGHAGWHKGDDGSEWTLHQETHR